jgi:hypothetical protein
MNEPTAVHYLPIATTIVSAIFCAVIFRRYLDRRTGPHLLWWSFGVLTYGLGTALESSITLAGNTVVLTKAWYVAGALLGGYPLAQGSVYLHLNRRAANVLTWITVPAIVAVSALVILSPVRLEMLEAYRPTGAVLGWQWVRLFTPIINLYAFVFLVGGAVISAIRFWKKHGPGARSRAIGNALIAFGALLPGIGGSMAKAGIVEGLYIGEFVGILFIWVGYRACIRPEAATLTPAASPAYSR